MSHYVIDSISPETLSAFWASSSWQLQTELASLTNRAFNSDGSAMKAHNALANGESQAGSRGTAGLISLVKAIEYFFSEPLVLATIEIAEK